MADLELQLPNVMIPIQVENWSDNYHSSVPTYEETIITEKGVIFLHLKVYFNKKYKRLLFHSGY